MGHDTGDDTALLQTISELRADVNRLVDEQLARVRALEEKRPDTAVERRFTAPPHPSQPAVRAPRAQVVSRTREPVEPPPKPAGSAAPSQRLDALARHLDGRLRRSGGKTKAAQGESPERPARGSGETHGTTSEARR